EIGLDEGEARVVAAKSSHDPGREVLDHDIDGADEVGDDLARPGMREIEGQAELPDVAADEVCALVRTAGLDLEIAPARLVAFPRSFDLDDARAEIGEQPRAVGSREHPREVENGHSVERRGAGHPEMITKRGRRTCRRPRASRSDSRQSPLISSPTFFTASPTFSRASPNFS